MKRYGQCPKKIASRDETIIRPWRNFSKMTSVPGQFWGFPGPIFGAHGELETLCEPEHMRVTDLISSHAQYYGVERVAEIHKRNMKAVQHLNPAPNLFHGEFHDVVDDFFGRKAFNPSILFLDTLWCPHRGAVLLNHVLRRCNYVDNQKLITLNVIQEQQRRGRVFTPDYVAQEIRENCALELARGKWIQDKKAWQYNGTGSATGTKMLSVTFYQKDPRAVMTLPTTMRVAC